jgi:hypothetical protein
MTTRTPTSPGGRLGRALAALLAAALAAIVAAGCGEGSTGADGG